MELPKKIQEAILSNSLVVFAGAGLSSNFNLPNWKQLVIDVINNIHKPQYDVFLPVLEFGAMNPSEVLNKLQSEHHEVKKYIKNNFKLPGTVDLSLHKSILELTKQIVTTNFDNAFELASDNTITPAIYTSEFNISEINKTQEPYILKMHGSYSEPDHCIIFEDQYKKLYSKETAAIEKLKSIFSEKLILFIGFSFSDADINQIFSSLDVAFKNNNKHFILTTDPNNFATYNFLETVPLSNYNEINLFIDECLKFKRFNLPIALPNNSPLSEMQKKPQKKIAFLYPDPIDLDFKEEMHKVISHFDSLEANLLLGTLNLKTLLSLEDYEIIIIVSKVYKTKLYIEEDNLKSNLITAEEVCFNLPNQKIPVIFITNEKIDLSFTYPLIAISSFRAAIINRFVYKAFKENSFDFHDSEITISDSFTSFNKISKGITVLSSIYGNNKPLEIGKKSLIDVIGRIEEQASITARLISIINSNKVLNVKASGGIGKTTLIRKVSYELYNRGYFTEGVTFRSCESIKTFDDFEELLIDGFNLRNILNFKDYLIENYSYAKIDLLVILDNFETVVNNLDNEHLQKAIDLLKFATDYANIVVTSREKITLSDDFEDVFFR